MQAAPAVQVLVQRFTIWNGALFLIGAAAVAVCGAWFGLRNEEVSLRSAALMVSALLMGLAGLCGSIRRHPVRMRWDSQCWTLAESSRPSDEIAPCQAHVVIDAGAWLLLKFVPEGVLSRRSALWLPVQRPGIEDQWHALRCALCSPRAAAVHPIGLDGPSRIE